MNVKHEETGISSKMDLAPLLKSLKARAPSASNLWAAEHKDLVERRREELGGSIGARQQAKAELFRALTTQEQAQWAAKAQEAKDQRLSNPDAYLEYVFPSIVPFSSRIDLLPGIKKVFPISWRNICVASSVSSRTKSGLR